MAEVMESGIAKTNEVINEDKLTIQGSTSTQAVIDRLNNFGGSISEKVRESVSAVSLEVETWLRVQF